MISEQKKVYMARYRKTDKNRSYMKEYKSRPENVDRLREYQREYAAKNRNKPANVAYRKKYISLPHVKDAKLKYLRISNSALKEAAINIYSNGDACCKFCKIADIDVLCLDHINDDGKEHRAYMRSLYGGGSAQIYRMVRKLDYPPILQVLCFNCNMKKEIVRKRDSRRMVT
jgi:hypothetical protein